MDDRDIIRGFVQFVLENQEEIEANNLGATSTEIALLLSSDWAKMELKDKSAYNRRALYAIPSAKASYEDFPEGFHWFSGEMRKIVRVTFPDAKIGMVILLIKETWCRLDCDFKQSLQLQSTLFVDSGIPCHDFVGFDVS